MRGNQNVNQPNFQPHGNHQNHLINAPPVRLAQTQAVDPYVEQFLTQMQQVMQRSQHQLISVSCHNTSILMVPTLEWPEIIRQLSQNLLHFKHDKVVCLISSKIGLNP